MIIKRARDGHPPLFGIEQGNTVDTCNLSLPDKHGCILFRHKGNNNLTLSNTIFMMEHKKNTNIKFVLLLAIFFLFVNSYSQNTKIDVSPSTSTLKSLIEKIENETDYTFIFSSSVDLTTKISQTLKQQSVESVLKQALVGTDFNKREQSSPSSKANQSICFGNCCNSNG